MSANLRTLFVERIPLYIISSISYFHFVRSDFFYHFFHIYISAIVYLFPTVRFFLIIFPILSFCPIFSSFLLFPYFRLFWYVFIPFLFFVVIFFPPILYFFSSTLCFSRRPFSFALPTLK